MEKERKFREFLEEWGKVLKDVAAMLENVQRFSAFVAVEVGAVGPVDSSLVSLGRSFEYPEENVRAWLDRVQRINNKALTGGLVQNYALIEETSRDFFEPVSRMAESARLIFGHFQQLEKLRRGLEGKIEKK